MSTALITGATGGFGLAFAQLLAEKKHDLVLTARNEAKLQEIKNRLEKTYGIRVYVFPCNLSEPDAAERVYRFVSENQQEIDILISNAGAGAAGAFADSDWSRQKDLVQLNIIGLMQLTHCFLKPMMERGHGKIMNVSSVAAFCAGPDMSVYYASKAFVQSFSEALSEEVKGTGVTVTAVLPGPTRTGFEQAASMKQGSRMFRYAGDAHQAAAECIRAMEKGSPLYYQGSFTKTMSIAARLLPRSLTRRFAGKMNH